MARDAQNQAKQTYQTASNFGNTASGQAGNLYSTLVPQFEQEASGNVGFNPSDLTAMNTASQQSLGGSVASAVGEGARKAAADRNSGGFAPAADEASREAGKTLSENALNVQNQNAMLKQKNRQAGLSGLNDLFKTENNDVLSSLGIENNATNSLTNAGNSGWLQNGLGILNAIKGAGMSGSGGWTL